MIPDRRAAAAGAGNPIAEGAFDMEQALGHGHVATGAQPVEIGGISQREDDLAFAAGLRLALLIGLALWALAVWVLMHFFL